MKLVYLTATRIPDDWAHVLQILQMCEAFSLAGAEVELLAPRRKAMIDANPYDYAGVVKNFKITKLPCLELFPGSESKFLFYLRTFSFFITAGLYLVFQKYDVLYTREHLAGLFFNKFIYEVHSKPDAGKGVYERLWKRARGFVVLTSFMKDTYVKSGLPEERITVAPDGVKLDEFTVNEARDEVRTRLSLPKDKYLVGYVGTLKTMQMEKGVGPTIEALAALPDDVEFYVVGGEPAHIEEYKQLAEVKGVGNRTHLIGKVAHDLVPQYLAAFDVVVAPFPDFEHYRYFMSPLKIFEYMAAGVPMIVTNLPSLREVLTDETAKFIPPDDVPALAQAIKELKDHPEEARALRLSARRDAEERFSWEARARGILSFIQARD